MQRKKNRMQLTSIPTMTNKPEYKAAKNGNSDSAKKLLQELYRTDIFNKLVHHPDALIIPVQRKAEFTNAIPMALALKLMEEYGNSISNQITYFNNFRHTGASAMARLMCKPTFQGKVIPKQEYFLVDDVMTTGSTIMNLHNYITSQGGIVIGCALVAAHRGGTDYIPDNTTRSFIINKFGNSLFHTLNTLGIAENLQELSKQQLLYIAQFSCMYSFRNKYFEMCESLAS